MCLLTLYTLSPDMWWRLEFGALSHGWKAGRRSAVIPEGGLFAVFQCRRFLPLVERAAWCRGVHPAVVNGLEDDVPLGRDEPAGGLGSLLPHHAGITALDEQLPGHGW